MNLEFRQVSFAEYEYRLRAGKLRILKMVLRRERKARLIESIQPGFRMTCGEIERKPPFLLSESPKIRFDHLAGREEQRVQLRLDMRLPIFTQSFFEFFVAWGREKPVFDSLGILSEWTWDLAHQAREKWRNFPQSQPVTG